MLRQPQIQRVVVDLADVERPLALFAEGIAGRFCHLKVGDEDCRRPGAACTCPACIDLFEDETLNAAIYQVARIGAARVSRIRHVRLRHRARPGPIPGTCCPTLATVVHRESDLTVFFNHFDAPAGRPVAVPRDRDSPGRGTDAAKVPPVRENTRRRWPRTGMRPIEIPASGDRPCMREADASVYDTAEAVIECYDMLWPWRPEETERAGTIPGTHGVGAAGGTPRGLGKRSSTTPNVRGGRDGSCRSLVQWTIGSRWEKGRGDGDTA